MSNDLKKFVERAKKDYNQKYLEKLGLTPEIEQRNKILSFMAMILKWNEIAGLVSPNDESKLFLRHFCDSLQPLLLFGFKKDATIIDIGSGGGFPAIPISIFRPDLKITMVESNRKKSSFLKEVVSLLELGNVSVISKRSEKIDDGKKYDYVISRGVGTLLKVVELGKPFLKDDGRIYTFKSKNFEEELFEVTNSKDKTGIGVDEIAEYDLGTEIRDLKLVAMVFV